MKKSFRPKEKDENMPSKCFSSDQREVKSLLSKRQHINPGQEDKNTVSHSQLLGNCANEIGDNGGHSLGMGHPGHYFQKALISVTQKSRSQSLPSCLESKKPDGLPKNDASIETITEHNSGENDVDVITVNVHSPNDAWFRTWPERGNEKQYNIGSSVDRNNLKSEKELSGCECSCLKKESLCCSQLNYKHLGSDDCVPERQNLEVNSSSQLQLASVSKTESSNSCREVNDINIHQNVHTKTKSFTGCVGNNTSITPIPLTELLQNIPLAYSPVTKQLHFISTSNKDSKCLSEENCAGKAYQNDDKQWLECIEEEGSENQSERCSVVVKAEDDDTLSYESPRSTLQRFGTNSLSRTDASSFSSIVSSLSDASPSSINDDADDISSNIHGSPSGSGDYFEEVGGAKSKRRGISAFFSRNVFAWKSSRDTQNNTHNDSGNNNGWRLFSRLSLKTSDQDVANQEPETGKLPESPASIRSTGSNGGKRYEDLVASSSALILHQRPSNLPAKSQDEEQKHRLEYQQMVEAARKKELKEAKLRKKQLQRQLKVEEQLANAARIWNNEILPKWDIMRNSRKARDLWWQGIPPSVRGKVWKLAIGNELNITHQLYNICLARAQERLKAAESGSREGTGGEDKEASVELIQLDISRTFPHLCIFQRGGPYYDMLHCLLGAYVCYRPDVGYVQGMSFIAAVLILNLEAADAFICFANLLNRPCHMAFFCLNQAIMNAYYAAYNEFFRENLPRLYTHFLESSLSADLYLLDWLYTVFAKAMPLDVACRVWDVFLRDGEEFLFKAALGVLHLNQEVLLRLDFIHGAQFLTKLPDDLAADQLFKSIEAIHMNVGKQRFEEVLAYHMQNPKAP